MPVYPASRGKGTHIFEDSEDLQLVEPTPFENGVVLLATTSRRQTGLEVPLRG
jgi:hypothetical protein